MNTIRLMIIDDSAAARRVFERMLADWVEIEVVASVDDARKAIEQLPVLKPDVITLDVEMPGLSGIEALRQIREAAPDAKVIMLSALTQRGSKTSVEAMELGAADILTKPGLGVSPSEFKKTLYEKLIALARARKS
jgi:two-component system, chemotaxis family, protein-glutamate methylesterase/glutaminase